MFIEVAEFSRVGSMRVNRPRVLTASAAAIVGIAVAMVFGSSDALAVSRSNPSTVVSVVASNPMNRAASAADAVVAYANSALPGVFGGVSLTGNGNSLVVHLRSITPRITGAIDKIAASTGVVPTFVTAPATTAQLNTMMDEITASASTLRASGITLASWTIDGQSGLIDVNIFKGTAKQDAVVATKFGSLVHVGNVTQLPILTTLSVAWTRNSFTRQRIPERSGPAAR